MKKLFIATTFANMLLLSVSSHAHNVVAGAYADGAGIEGEIGLSNGDMALPGTLVEVYVDGEKIGETHTNADGLFQWQATVRADHRFYANLGAGHIADMVLPGEDLIASLPALTGESAIATAQASTTTRSSLNDSELSQLVSSAVARQIKPLRREIISLKEKAGLRDALGGIGYIFGLCGVGCWLAAQQKQGSRKTDAPVS